MKEYKTEMEVANEILSFVQNPESRDDALTFASLFLVALAGAGWTGIPGKVWELLAESDERFKEGCDG